jgi:hypothetical protein
MRRAAQCILVALVIAWLASLLGWARLSYSRPSGGGVLAHGVSLRNGSVWIRSVRTHGGEASGLRLRGDISPQWPSVLPRVKRETWGPGGTGWSRDIVVPILCLALPLAAWLTLTRKRGASLCPCGYDARGLDVCPECGREVQGMKGQTQGNHE